MSDEFAPFFGPPGSVWDTLWNVFIALLPVVIAQIAVLVIAICLFKRHAKAAALLIAAVLLSLTLQFAWPVVQQLLWESDFAYDSDPDVFYRWMRFFGYINISGHGIAWLLAAFAVFAGRRAAQSTTHEVHTTGEHTMMDTPPTHMTAASAAPLNAQPIAKGKYLGTIIGCFVVSTLLIIPGYAIMLSAGRGDDEQVMLGIGITCAALIPMIVGIVFLMILIYKLWTAIQSEYSTTTPGLAVGLLFVPLFNYYWIFRAYYCWAKDFNKLVRGRSLHIPQTSESLPLIICILTICGIIPFIGMLIGVVNLILMAVFLNNAINGVNQLAALQTQPAAQPAAM